MPTSSLPLTNPKTYEGIDPSTKEVVGPITAQNADEIIDPAEVAKKIKNASEIIEKEMGNLASGIAPTADDSKEAIIIEGTDMSETINEIANIIKEFATEINKSIEGLYEESVNARNHIQDLLNDQARQSIVDKGLTPRELG